MSIFDQFRASTPLRQGIVIAAAFALLCVCGAAIYFNFIRVPYSTLFTNLKTSDAATIVADLDKKKIPYRLQDGGATILAPANLVDATRLDVMSEDLPIKGQVGFELFNKSDMGLTEFAQKINYQRALQGELARTIMTLDAVDTARVHLSLPDPSVFREDRRAPKASATIIARPGRQLSLAAVAGIRRLIAAAVPDLEPPDVVLLDEHGDILGGDLPSGQGLGAPPSPPDGIERSARPGPAPAASAAAEFEPARMAAATPSPASTFWSRLSIGLLVLLAFATGFLARRGKGDRRLSEREKTSYVDRFRALLEEEGTRADRSV